MQHFRRISIFVLALVLLSIPFLTGTPVLADPDFSNVNDILAGRRELFPVDDLVISSSFGGIPVLNTIAQTENGDLGDEIDFEASDTQAEFVTGVGRMFHSVRDFVVTIAAGQVTIRDQNPDGAVTKTFPLNVAGAPNQNQFPRADFTGDGYADFAYLVGNDIYIVTAQDVTNIDAGLFYSQPGAAPFDLTNQWAALAAGDFDGNGTPEVALAAAQNNQITVTLYVVASTLDQQGQLTGITLTPSGSTTFNAPKDILGMALVSGVYTLQQNAQTSLPLEQLVALYHYNNGDHYADLTSIQIEIATTDPTTFDLYTVNTLNWVKSEHNLDFLSMVSGFLDFFGPTEQIVATVQEPGNYSHLAVFTLDQNLVLTRANEKITEEEFSNVVSVVLGNFDQDTNAQEPISLEIGVLRFTTASLPIETQAELLLYNINPANNFEVTQYTSKFYGEVLPYESLSNQVYLSAGDTQGRSLLLGAPTKVTAQNNQPTIILGMPPMHVDWVTPNNGTSSLVLNLSAVPLSFFSSYISEESSKIQTVQKGTTSFSTSISESLETKLSYGVPDVASATVEIKASSEQQWENSTSKTYSNYTDNNFEVSAQTGFDDQIWYISQNQNFYVYPIIGHLTCPEPDPPVNEPPTPLCTPAEQVPLNLTLAGPDTIQPTEGMGAGIEWYQPVREPGNVFSYPWSLAQMELIEPRIALLTSDAPTKFYTDGSTLNEQAKWSAGSSTDVTSGSTSNYTWNTSISVSDDVSIPEAGGLGGADSATFSYGGSKSFSTLHSTTTALAESTGIGITKPGTFANPGEYAYAIEPYIYGTNPVSGTIQVIDLGTTVQANGVLAAEFTANPRDASAGAWWQTESTYAVPDVALNHPNRWSVTAVTTGTFGSDCLPIGPGTTTVNCASFIAPETDTWASEFHWMKGLLITPAEANGRGPQITSVVAGNDVQLQARVYNYSLTDMPAGSQVMVRFYGQPWNNLENVPTADAFLIEQVPLAPIPAFNSQTTGNGELPNWSLASTTNLDTAAYADQYLVFWVVVWMQDAAGNLIGEMPEHGLTQIPGTLTDVQDATPLLEQYSNNVGFFKMGFFVEPPLSEAADYDRRLKHLRVDPIQLSTQTALLGEKVIISANVHSDKENRGVSVNFYQGNPETRGTAFEYEGISHIRAGGTHQVKTIFRPQRCGNHNLFIKVYPSGQTARARLQVTINPRRQLRQMMNLIKTTYSQTELFVIEKRGDGMFGRLKVARRAFKNNDSGAAFQALANFESRAQAQRAKSLPEATADILLAQAAQIRTCVK